MRDELEILKRRRLLELQRRLLKPKPELKEETTKKPGPKEVINRQFTGRAWEVYNAAWAQFPSAMATIEKALAEAMISGKIKGNIDGESLYRFLRKVGLPVRLRTTIKFKEHGELKTLEQKIRETK